MNQSLDYASPSSADVRPKYHSIDYQSNAEDVNSIKSERRRNKEDAERDQILQKLSQKNE